MPDSIGRVKACTECRQQKVKCDAFKDYSRPCSRCRAAGLPCVISKDFQRRPRQTKAQLQYELDRLKAKSHPDATPNNGDHGSSENPHTNEQPDMHRGTSSGHVSDTPGSSQQRGPSNSEGNPSLQELLHRSSSEQHVQSRSSPTESSSKVEGTAGRTLEGVTLDPGKVNDCYALFLSHYAVHTHGLLEMVISPNQRYEESPLLFWAMVCVGSRGYSKDLTLYGRLGEPVLDLMFKSLIRPSQPLPVIQAAVILCRWPLPVDLIYREPSEALAGAAMSLAMQNGLHMYSREQDFVTKTLRRTPRPAYYDLSASRTIRDEVVSFRTRIWAFCNITFQDVFICDGLPPLGIVPCFRRSENYGDIHELLPERLGYRVRLHHFEIEATNLVAGFCDVHGKKHDQTLNAMITSHDDSVRQVPLPHDSTIFRFMRSCARVAVMGLIYVAQQEPDHIHALRLYRITRETVALILELERETPGSSFYLPHYYIRMAMAATHIMLRMCKSPLGEKLDLNDAETAIFAMVDVFKSRVHSSKDLLAYHCVMLPELWASKTAFVHGGKVQNGLRVNMRYRLVLNPVFDNFWWWRKEFGRSLDDEHKQGADTSGLQEPSTSGTGEHTTDANGGNYSRDSPYFATMGPPQPDQMSSMDMPMPAGDGFWTSSLDTVFADFMQWWDFSALNTDMIQSDEYSPGDGSSTQDTQMAQSNNSQTIHPYDGTPQTLMSGADRLT